LNPNSYPEQLEKEINFLVFWGKLDRYSATRMPRWKRRKWIDWTIENLELIFGNNT